MPDIIVRNVGLTVYQGRQHSTITGYSQMFITLFQITLSSFIYVSYILILWFIRQKNVNSTFKNVLFNVKQGVFLLLNRINYQSTILVLMRENVIVLGLIVQFFTSLKLYIFTYFFYFILGYSWSYNAMIYTGFQQSV